MCFNCESLDLHDSRTRGLLDHHMKTGFERSLHERVPALRWGAQAYSIQSTHLSQQRRQIWKSR